jgi:tRNA U34 5-carboxymethylaminomethyl modifying GTPase MnmE/TrmE
MDLENPSTWLTGGAATGILIAAYKFLWPVLSSALNSAVANTRTGDQLMKQVMDERDRAVTRADEADKRVEAMVRELYSLKNSVDLLTFQLKVANEKIEALTGEVRRLEGGAHA